MLGLSEANLEPQLVGKIAGTFFVRAYQRGYRWTPVEVERLLEDIWENRDRPYYLQPVVLKQAGEEWELVDGQQRMTTLFLIFRYMELEGLQSTGAGFSLRYETRPGSAEFLRNPTEERCRENIDFFYIFGAYRCIAEWFERDPSMRQYRANKFYDALFESVKVIWYEAPPELDAIDLFTRLNVGRIPLTDAELVKALLLTRSRDGSTDRAHEVAAQWDAIERDLRDRELWAFLTGRTDREPTHISLLLDTLAGRPEGAEPPLFHTFETLKAQIDSDPQAFWDRVISLHGTLLGWHEDRDVFHKAGFLIADGAATLASLIELARGLRRSAFEAELDGLIRGRLDLSEAGLRELAYPSTKAERALFLMNVETVRRHVHSTERYSFHEHAEGRWSLEHIHAQNAERLNKAEQWAEWLRMHRDVVQVGGHLAGDEAGNPRPDRPGTGEAAGRRSRLPEAGTGDPHLLSDAGSAADDEVDSIANLALLSGRDNSALSNSVFAVKRSMILDLDRRGDYIPICTRNVFLKYYTPTDSQQLHLWSASDRECYLAAVVDALEPYLRDEDGAK
ncbi:MAG: DUF262 domain-containing protein [Acidimicrobiales bacterium]